MIEIDYDFSNPINQIILVLATCMLAMQIWFLVFRKQGFLTNGRFAVRLGLNVLLWLAILGFILQPEFQRKAVSKGGIIFGKDVPSDFAEKLADSLSVNTITDFSDLEDLSNYDSLALAGQNFQPEVFENLAQSKHHPLLKWIPFFENDQIQDLSWKGVLRKGEIQTIRGNLQSSENQLLKVKFGDQTLDSTVVSPDNTDFRLSFPVFSLGRTSAEIELNGKTLDTIHFFSRPSEKFTLQFILDNPDFESRALANWLGKNGHSVIYTTALSKDIKSELKINKTEDLDVVITDPSNSSNAKVKQAVAKGKSVLFINLTDAIAETRRVNIALGSKFDLNKISNDVSVPVLADLTALPFQFIPANYHSLVKNYPVAVEKVKGKIGVSLLNETFPLMLTGDSTAYDKVWNSIFASILPVSKSNLTVNAPIYAGLENVLLFNNFNSRQNLLQIGNDSVFFTHSTINNLSSEAGFSPLQSGWLPLSDSLDIELYAERGSNSKARFNTDKTKDFVQSYTSFYNNSDHKISSVSDRSTENMQRISDWIWFALVIACLLGVWVEGKL